MKWIATMLLVLACGMGSLVGCEQKDNAPSGPPAQPTADQMPDADEPATAPTTAPAATQASASLAVANQYCAVMGDHKIDPKVTVAHGDKTIGFCCEDCIPKFKAEPAKYLASMK